MRSDSEMIRKATALLINAANYNEDSRWHLIEGKEERGRLALDFIEVYIALHDDTRMQPVLGTIADLLEDKQADPLGMAIEAIAEVLSPH